MSAPASFPAIYTIVLIVDLALFLQTKSHWKQVNMGGGVIILLKMNMEKEICIILFE